MNLVKALATVAVAGSWSAAATVLLGEMNSPDTGVVLVSSMLLLTVTWLELKLLVVIWKRRNKT